jgi:uncharacterized protein
MIDQNGLPSNEESPETRENAAGSAPEWNAGIPAIPLLPVLKVQCWRCSKMVDASLPHCIYCGASLLRVSESQFSNRAAQDASLPLIRTLIAFGIMLGISVIAGVTLHLEREAAPNHRRPSESEGLGITLGLEALDTILVIVSLCVVRIRSPGFSRTFGQKAAAWVGFSVLLGGLLILNVVYHHFLRQIAPIIELPRHPFGNGGIFWLWGLAICVQPAIVEELFFRYLSIGTLRSVVSSHGAVWVSATMFALAHIYVPLSLPVLFCLGVALGYARVASGGMALPMVMHFFHNVVVMYLQNQM